MKWKALRYVYPVVSRRSGGVSIGIDLTPSKICNAHCVYCDVNRSEIAPNENLVDLDTLELELLFTLRQWRSGDLFKWDEFKKVPEAQRALKDIAFSGNGEPTASPQFREIVALAAALRDAIAPPETKLVLITNGTCLDRPGVLGGLRRMQQGAYAIWAKLDAGTPRYYRRVNRSAVPFKRILDNIAKTAEKHPVTIQTLFLKLRGKGPDTEEIDAYCERINALQRNGGRFAGLQLHTVARPTAETWAQPLEDKELDAIASRIKESTGLPQQVVYRSTYQVPRQAVMA